MKQPQSAPLSPVQTIQPQGWMRDPATAKIMAALQDPGAPLQALFVGGCVRNTLLGLEAGDIDIATVHSPSETTARLQKAGLKAVPTGIDHGTVTGVAEGKGFEITTLRKDVETDGRRAVVAFTDDWREDAQRRDFTMNTLLMDAEGNVYDPTGQGLADLKAARVVFVGDPAQRIAEDYLRALRFFRFYGTYGKGAPDEAALKACEAAAAKIPGLSRERITQEFLKILALPGAAGILKVMFDHRVLKELSSYFDEESFSTLCNLQEKFLAPSRAARLLALLNLSVKNMNAFEKFLIFSNAIKKEFNLILEALAQDVFDSQHAIRVSIYRYGPEATLQVGLLWAAQGDAPKNLIAKIVAEAREWKIPVFPVTGDDLVKKGMQPGPDLGRELKRFEEEWIKRGFIQVQD